METINNSSNKITIIGLGSMGSTIASLYLQHKYEVTVWNRNAEKAKQLVQNGAVLAKDIVEAVKASPIVIICVYDYKATHEIFIHDEIASALTGKTVIQLTTGSPKDATDSESWFNEYGAEYLDGAIQVAPEQMAQSDTTILLSGSTEIYTQNKTLLEILGGNITYLGNTISSAAAMDLATLSYVYGSIFGFLHGVLIAETNQLDVNVFS
ncbi:NAD(P)-dependent oxidoreductase [Pedobacter sp. NJ-S-72]